MKKKILFLIAALLFCCVGFVAYQVFGPTLSSPQKKYFYIKTGSTFEDVTTSLLDEKIIENKFWFLQVAKKLNYAPFIKAGKYEIKKGMSVFNLVRLLRSGNQTPVNFVITKLRTKEDLAQKIAAHFECDSLSVISFLNNSDSIKKYGVDSNTVMTLVIPNTYSILWNTSAAKIIKKLYLAQQAFWNEDRKAKAAALHFTTVQIYSLASIVEEETNQQKDVGNIASVYINRIQTGQRLEADPTIKFALRNFGLKRVREVHIKAVANSPYNTYFNTGLPPGPICTPSSKTIDAVLNAPTTNYLFFVAQPNWSGLSNFTNNYSEHLINAKKYQHFLDSVNIR